MPRNTSSNIGFAASRRIASPTIAPGDKLHPNIPSRRRPGFRSWQIWRSRTQRSAICGRHSRPAITTASALVQAYLARIAAYDCAGPLLNAVRETNPEALAIAAAPMPQAGRTKAARRHPDPPQGQHRHCRRQHTTAGSLALAEARARHDATIVTLLRQAGAIILGKANLTEFANILAIDMPAGYSSLGGQVRNPYAPQLEERAMPVVSPGGSSSGSAVAVAAGSGGGGDRHRDLGLAVVARLPERSGHGQAHGRARSAAPASFRSRTARTLPAR